MHNKISLRLHLLTAHSAQSWRIFAKMVVVFYTILMILKKGGSQKIHRVRGGKITQKSLEITNTRVFSVTLKRKIY